MRKEEIADSMQTRRRAGHMYTYITTYIQTRGMSEMTQDHSGDICHPLRQLYSFTTVVSCTDTQS